MKKNNFTMYLAFIGIFIVIFSMVLATYAYFTVEIEGSGKDLTATSFNENMEITFNDTSNVTLINAYTGDSITKTFTVSNTGATSVFYDITLSELVNNFVNLNDLVYTLSSTDGGAIRTETVVPSVTDSALASNIKISPTETHSYTLVVTFLKTTENQSNNMNKTFSSKIKIVSSDQIHKNYQLFASDSLGGIIVSSFTLNNSNSLDYSLIPTTNGLYYTNNTVNGATIYYFRGNNNLNNNVLFAGKCFKIIRTTEDYGIRLIYNGTPVGNTCPNTTEASTNAFSSSFNGNYSYNAYVGYNYGSPNSLSYGSEHANTNNSTIKGQLNTWYASNLSSYSSYLQDSYYCNNRKTKLFTIGSILYGSSGYGNNNTGYDSYYRINVSSTVIPNLDCSGNDLFTISNATGTSGTLANPIGLLTADEAVLVGYTTSNANTTSYLYNGYNYWTMTPAYFYSNKAYNYYINSDLLNVSGVNEEYYVRPVITLKQDTVVLSGNGSTNTPYKITN